MQASPFLRFYSNPVVTVITTVFQDILNILWALQVMFSYAHHRKLVVFGFVTGWLIYITTPTNFIFGTIC